MTLVAVLLGFGVLLLAAEVVVPGGILGIAGGVLLLVGVIVAFYSFEQGKALVVLGIALLAGGAVFVLEFVVLPRSKLVRSLSMSGTVTGRAQAIDASAVTLIGRVAVAQTKLVPSGLVTVDDRRFEAFCRDGAVEPGTQLRVVGVDSFRLIVAHSQTQT
jgi:membrane-bound serine protease (ClpP class)